MKTFKEFTQSILMEHVVKGSLSGSPDGLLKVVTSADKKYLFLIPKHVEDENLLHWYINRDGQNLVKDVVDSVKADSSIAEFKKPDAVKDQLTGIKQKIYSNIEFGGILYGSEFKDSVSEVLGKDSTFIDSVIGSIITYSFYGSGLETKKFPIPMRALGLSYLLLNTVSKEISIEMQDKSTKSRIGKLTIDSSGRASNSNTAYVIPLSSPSIDRPDKVVKILQSLVKFKSELNSWTFVNTQVSPTERLSVGDVLSGIGQLSSISKSILNASRFTGEILAYHGTSAKIANSILKTGLAPGFGYEYKNKIKGHSENNVYLTTSLSDARKYATRAAGSSNAVVLSVKVTDPTKIVFDEDLVFNSLQNVPENLMNELKYRLMRYYEAGKIKWPFQHREDYVRKEGLAMTTLSAHSISDLFVNQAFMSEFKGFRDVITTYSFKGNSVLTFAYRGKIPPSDIAVVEMFKSFSHKDSMSQEEFDTKYDALVAAIKTGNNVKVK